MEPRTHDRRTHLVLVSVVVLMALIGFVIGTRPHEPESSIALASARSQPSGDAQPARDYRAMRGLRGESPTELELQRLRDAPSHMPGEPVTIDTAARAADLAAREERRAFFGAPPTVPHPVPQSGDLPCLECHGSPMTIDGILIPKMSHRPLTSCTQCHVSIEGPMPGARLPWSVDSRFTGLESPWSGERAWPGAPPTIPHSTLMREDCLSCHGPSGRPSLRTSHPERQNCVQCHGRSSVSDQLPTSPFPGGGLK